MTTTTHTHGRVRLAHTAFVQPAAFWRSVDCLQAASVDDERIGVLTSRLGLQGLADNRNWSSLPSDRTGRILGRIVEWPAAGPASRPLLGTAGVPFMDRSTRSAEPPALVSRTPLCPVLARTLLPLVDRDMIALIVASTDAAQQMLATRILLDNADLPVMTHELTMTAH